MRSIVRIRAGDKLTEDIEELRWKDSNEVFEMLFRDVVLRPLSSEKRKADEQQEGVHDMTPFPRCGKYDAVENAYPFANQPPKDVNPSSAGPSCAHAAPSNKVRQRTLQWKVAGMEPAIG